MTDRKFQLATTAMWLALPLLALRTYQVWDRLPARMATHFDASGHANGWMSRESSLTFSLGFMAFMLAIFSIVIWASHRKSSVGTFSWALLVFFYLQIGLIYLLLNQVLAFNLDGTPVNPMTLIFITAISILVLLVVYLGSHRGEAVRGGSLVAEESHAGKALALIALVPLVVLFWGMNTPTLSAARIPLGLVALLAFGACVMAWSGFHYLFTSSGVEIRTLGFRLRTIPVDQIKEYARDSWSIAGGYGIRGIGKRRAYVWGNQGVRIQTNDGEVFLGHSDPARIIRDLDAIKKMPHQKTFERQAGL
jgi:uncharacterized protein DUF1648